VLYCYSIHATIYHPRYVIYIPTQADLIFLANMCWGDVMVPVDFVFTET
jgi:hypothetical protein